MEGEDAPLAFDALDIDSAAFQKAAARHFEREPFFETVKRAVGIKAGR